MRDRTVASNDGASDAIETPLNLKAVGLNYNQLAGGLPTVSVVGRGHIVARLIELAREHGVEIREDADLVEILSVLQEGDEIPVEAIHAVAAILAWIYRSRPD